MKLATYCRKIRGIFAGQRLSGTRAIFVCAVIAAAFTPGVVGANSRSVLTAVNIPAVATFTVDGQVATPLTLTVDDLSRNYEGHEATSQFTKGCVTQGHLYRGVLLRDVLTTAHPSFDAAIENVKLRYAVLVSASDDYQAVVSWGEIDPGYADIRVLLAYQQDGVPLTRPHLIVPGDEKGGRYVCNITNVSLLRVQR